MRFTSSLRIKFTLALLISSLLSLAVAGLVARAILFREFNHVVMQESFQRYHMEMTAYFKAYGSWENARRHEDFGSFEKKRRSLYGAPPQNGLRAVADAEESLVRGPKPSSLTAVSTSLTAQAVEQEKGRPPFRFALTDARGRVLMGGNSFKVGELAPASLRAAGKPIVINGETLAFALPDPHPNLNNLDFGYLQALRQALLAAGLSATLLALVLGLVIGTRLNRRLHQLTAALKAMQEGALRQRVEVHSPDEIGILTDAFNRMSTELAEAHEALQQSNQQINRQAQQLKELSIRDSLTGLYNRRHFDEQGARVFAESMRYEQPLSVMIGDIDFFKKINDRFSHAIGDEVLRRVAALLQENTRRSDVLARYGGEEFVIVFPQTPLASAAAHCENLRTAIEEYSWHEVHPDLCVTMSMGLSDDITRGGFEKMLAAADEQLYIAKESGRNQVCCNAQTKTKAAAADNEYWPSRAPFADETAGREVLFS